MKKKKKIIKLKNWRNFPKTDGCAFLDLKISKQLPSTKFSHPC